ncbi:unnamed protein product [Closterium sp. Naga37s-1]|nr:unnamed protein product [Closterium sp. Naga37s-1]
MAKLVAGMAPSGTPMHLDALNHAKSTHSAVSNVEGDGEGHVADDISDSEGTAEVVCHTGGAGCAVEGEVGGGSVIAHCQGRGAWVVGKGERRGELNEGRVEGTRAESVIVKAAAEVVCHAGGAGCAVEGEVGGGSVVARYQGRGAWVVGKGERRGELNEGRVEGSQAESVTVKAAAEVVCHAGGAGGVVEGEVGGRPVVARC